MTSKKEECFIIMPISDPEGYEKGHFKHIYADIITPACEKAGYQPVRADDINDTNMIHLDILKRLLDTPMAICDLSSRNPNVLFELGLRQAFDKPVVLIQEEDTPQIFDITLLRVVDYRQGFIYHQVIEDQNSIAEAIKSTKEATENKEGVNSLVKLLSLSKASTNEIQQTENNPMLQIVLAEMDAMRQELRRVSRNINQINIIERGTNIADHFERPQHQLAHLKDNFKQVKNSCLASNSHRRKKKGIELCHEIIRQAKLASFDEELPSSIRKEYKNLIASANKLIDNMPMTSIPCILEEDENA